MKDTHDIVIRSLQWDVEQSGAQRALDLLLRDIWDAAFKLEETFAVSAAIAVLLGDEDLCKLHRAQLEIYSAAQEKEEVHVRKHILNAGSVVEELEAIALESGLFDPRVNDLRSQVTAYSKWFEHKTDTTSDSSADVEMTVETEAGANEGDAG